VLRSTQPSILSAMEIGTMA